jgi:type VI protein secretion system component VasF
MISTLLIFLMQAVQDTAASGFAPKWHGAHAAQNASSFMTMMASHNLIFIVLGVSLIIWFVLLFFIIRTDRKITHLERQVNGKINHQRKYKVDHEA